MSSSGRQQQRTQATISTLLSSATRLFGERGYANTSLEDIAEDCGLTIGAIYHHFGNKKALFSAVNEAVERRIIDAGEEVSGVDSGQMMQDRWRAFLALCDDPGFRRIVLVDSPHILGRDRWSSSEVTTRVVHSSLAEFGSNDPRHALTLRILRGAMAEAALALAEADNCETTRTQIDEIIGRILSGLSAHLHSNPS